MVSKAAFTAFGVAGCGVSTRDRSLIGLPRDDTTIALSPVPPMSMQRVLGSILRTFTRGKGRLTLAFGAVGQVTDPGTADAGSEQVDEASPFLSPWPVRHGPCGGHTSG